MEAVVAPAPARTRSFLPENLTVESWEDVKPYYEELKTRRITSVQDLKKWMKDRNELKAAVYEEGAWRFIRMVCDTSDEKAGLSNRAFNEHIKPFITENENLLDRKLVESPYTDKIDEPGHKVYMRGLRKEIEIFRKDNIPLEVKVDLMGQQYSNTFGAMTVEANGEKITIDQASVFLQNPDRNLRREFFFRIGERRANDAATLNNLFSDMLGLRHTIAENAGFENFRDYMFASMGRFDYTPTDCLRFHDAVQTHIVPLLDKLAQQRKEALNADVLKPWDMEVDPENKPRLEPFQTGRELVEKSLEVLNAVRPKFAAFLNKMDEAGRLDLESRKGKAPGGFQSTLLETKVPFIYMNAVGIWLDINIMMHEAGHAAHTFLTNHLDIHVKRAPSEVSELASMSMELFSMEHWDVFFKNPDDLKRAKLEQIKRSLNSILSSAAVDKFQHWLYQHPHHSLEERQSAWRKINKEFSSTLVDNSDWENYRGNGWHPIMHIFTVPFYFIEYAFAQLGAIALWRNYKQNKEKTLDAYEKALSLGYTKTIPEIYEAAGIKFDFSEQYIKELAVFMAEEWDKLN